VYGGGANGNTNNQTQENESTTHQHTHAPAQAETTKKTNNEPTKNERAKERANGATAAPTKRYTNTLFSLLVATTNHSSKEQS